jgi:ubiquitin carboxyl-terminal hydrolase 5/13
MASVLQSIFALPAFQKRYIELAKNHPRACTISLPADCVECQMHKVADGLLSGRYSHPANYSSNVTPPSDPLQHASPTPVFQTGVRPMGFKTLIGKGHEEFATMKQQDSEEFFTHLLTVLRRDMHKHKDRSNEGKCLSQVSFALR